MPHGYVLGLILFTLYTGPLDPIVSVNANLYAADTQLYILFKPRSKLSEAQTLKSRGKYTGDIKE